MGSAINRHAIITKKIAEINPILDNKNMTAEMAVDLLLSGFGKKIL